MVASIDGRNQSVTAELGEFDYARAIEAHRDKAPLVMRGELSRIGQRWRLLDPSIVDVIKDDNEPQVAD